MISSYLFKLYYNIIIHNKLKYIVNIFCISTILFIFNKFIKRNVSIAILPLIEYELVHTKVKYFIQSGIFNRWGSHDFKHTNLILELLYMPLCFVFSFWGLNAGCQAGWALTVAQIPKAHSLELGFFKKDITLLLWETNQISQP